MEFEIYLTNGADYRWRIYDQDDKTLLVSPYGVKTREEAEEIVEKIKAGLAKTLK